MLILPLLLIWATAAFLLLEKHGLDHWHHAVIVTWP